MVRTAVSVVVALLILAPAVGLGQQARPQAPDTPHAASTVPADGEALPAAGPTPSPAPPALREGMARALPETPAVPKAIPSPPSGSWGVVASGDGGGGIFRDTDSEAEAWLGSNHTGVTGYGNTSGGFFKSSTSSGFARLGMGDWGLGAFGDYTGGYFQDADGSGYVWLGYDRPSGTDKGGSANDGEYGVYAGGSRAGAYFEDTDHNSYAYIARGGYGVDVSGSAYGGFFCYESGSGSAYLGVNHFGISSYGDSAGGKFFTDQSGYAEVAVEDRGISATGDNAGGFFEDTTSYTYAYVGYSSYKIYGPGSVDFVQNHPYDDDSVIVYAAPEGDEVATYTRGTAKLVNGEATVPLGETFKWVTNPDIGLTAHLTPRGEPIPLAVARLSTEEMVVRGPADAPEGLVFDYIVYGLRIGFEETSVVQEKQMEAYIPSMKDHRDLYARRPDLRHFNSLERFEGMRRADGKSAELDLSRANALRDAIVEFDPAVHELPVRPGHQETTGELRARRKPTGERAAVELTRRAAPAEREVTVETSTPAPGIPVDADGNVYASSFRPSARDLASLVEVSEPVEPGDVLVIDREARGLMRMGRLRADPGVVGIVAAAPGVVLGTRSGAGEQPEPADETAGGAEEIGTAEPAAPLEAPVAFSGVVACKVDASYGPVWPGDLLVTSPTPGHAMREASPLPGTVLGKALEPLAEGTGTIQVLVMLR